MAKCGYYTRICMEGVKNTTNNLRITGFSVEIRTEHLSNSRLDRYRYIKLLGAPMGLLNGEIAYANKATPNYKSATTVTRTQDR
jgi:hypothetical protein